MSSFLGSFSTQWHDQHKSMVDMKPGDSGVVIGFRLMNLTALGWREFFITHLPWFHRQGVNTDLILLEPDCEDY